MAEYKELKTSLKQRIVIALVAVLMLGSTVALYVGVVMGSSDATGSSSVSAKEARLNELFDEYYAAMDVQAAELSETYFDQFKSYRSNVKAFNAASVTELKTQDIVVGDGIEIGENDIGYSAYYIGWLSDETIFDSSLNDTSNPSALKYPLAGGSNMIEGWLEGVIGMRIGGVREITIPYELGYKDVERETIPAYSPLKFIVMLIPEVAEPDYPDELLELYFELYGNS